ncbi:hypothetical protein GGR53DRAFT_468470 [Hypoxylon sp. FL1150]|nr:hypothetical protein GGR53DRAFT_468470 [Hypoxylon sp. FL1150]
MDLNGVGLQLPAYPGHYDQLQSWQRRWNREWVTEAVIPGSRMMVDRIERDWYYEGSKALNQHLIDENNRVVESKVARWELFLPGADKKGKRGLFRRALHHITLFLHLEQLKLDYQGFQRWRQERREAADKVEIEVDMEDEGDDPRWKGKMTFTMEPKLYAQYMDTDTWFPFPTSNNIRWYWVSKGGSRWRLRGAADGRWGPSTDIRYRMPFRCIHGDIQRNVIERGNNVEWCECRLRDDF